MAKKAKKDLTLEEKLQNALVADWEQPYALPENWVWTRLGEVAEYKKGPFGSSITKSMFVPKSDDTFKVYEQGNAIQKNENYGSYHITKEKFLELQSFSIKEKDIIVSCAGTIGEIFEIPEKHEAGIINQALMRIRIKNICKLFYLNYFSGIIHSDIESKSKGTAIKNIPPFSILKNIPFPLPPLAEQERIVQRIESLFAKLDSAKELLEEALESFESRKSALLHQAFTGELTKTWREKHGVSMESWQKKTLDSLSSLITKGASPKWQGIEYTADKTQTLFITSENVREGFLDLTKEKYLDNKINTIQKRSILKKGDVLLNIVGASIGRSAIFNLDNLANTNQAVAMIRTTDDINNIFLSSYLNSPSAKLFYNDTKVDVARANISLGDIKAMLIHLPTLPEQEEIVRILDAQLHKEEEAKAHIQHSLAHIEHMKKAILARAFRGELGTNNPEEASAMELLKEILSQERSAPKEKKPSKRFAIPKEITKELVISALEKLIYESIAEKQELSIHDILTFDKDSLKILQSLDRMEKMRIIAKSSDTKYIIKD